MIVTCERCATQFQLDDARVPEDGVRVRCSQCKHAFRVSRGGGAADADPVQEAAQRGLESGETPDVTQDLASGSEDAADDGSLHSDDGGFDWNFDEKGALDAAGSSAGGAEAPDEPAAADPDALFDLAVAEGAAPDLADVGLGSEPDLSTGDDSSAPVSAADSEDDLALAAEASEGGDELGSPTEWNIFDEDEPPPAAGPPRREYVPTRRRGEAPTVQIPLDAEVDGEPERSGVWLRRFGGSVGWLATAVLCGFGLLRGLTPAPVIATAPPAPAPGLEIRGLRSQWIDNAIHGEVLVVSGQLHHTGTGLVVPPDLELVWIDADGRALGRPLRVGVPRAHILLREARADVVAAPVRVEPLRPGASRAFEAVAWPLPRAAERYQIRRRG